MTNVFDGKHDAASISELFACKYKQLYTSVPCDADDITHVMNEVKQRLADCSPNEYIISAPEVKSSVRLLKKYKRDRCTGLSSDHILHAGDDCFVHIALLLSSIIVHAAVPQQFLRSSISPIPKGWHMN